MRRNIIVTGIPASGKSTVGSIISQSLNLALLDKDDILESLFDTRGVGDVEWRSMLSREADRLLRERALKADGAVIVSWWRHPNSTRPSGTPIEWLSELPGITVEVHCVCDPQVAARRFKQRRRHEGHLDGNKIEGELITSFREHAALGPLGLRHLIKVNTDQNINEQDLLSQIEFFQGSDRLDTGPTS